MSPSVVSSLEMGRAEWLAIDCGHRAVLCKLDSQLKIAKVNLTKNNGVAYKTGGVAQGGAD